MKYITKYLKEQEYKQSKRWITFKGHICHLLIDANNLKFIKGYTSSWYHISCLCSYVANKRLSRLRFIFLVFLHVDPIFFLPISHSVYLNEIATLNTFPISSCYVWTKSTPLPDVTLVWCRQIIFPLYIRIHSMRDLADW